jgi:hypothetical protein
MVKKISVEQFTGAVSVEGDVTPITRQPVDKVEAGNWGKMTVSELHKQREILQRRYYQALNAGLMNGAETINQGIMTIDAILENMGNSDSLGFL